MDVELIAGSGGVFDVRVDGEVIFSRHATADRRFPDHDEVVAALRNRGA